MSALCGQWRVGQGGGTCVLWVPGEEVHHGGGGERPTSAQGKTVISNNQALPFPRGMGCLGGRQSQLQRCHHAMDSIPVSKAE